MDFEKFHIKDSMQYIIANPALDVYDTHCHSNRDFNGDCKIKIPIVKKIFHLSIMTFFYLPIAMDQYNGCQFENRTLFLQKISIIRF